MSDRKFEIDEQTLLDLGIFNNDGNECLLDLFNRTSTVGGRNKIKQMMENPFSDFRSLQDRQLTLIYIERNQISLAFINHEFDFIEHYLGSGLPVLSKNPIDLTTRIIKSVLINDPAYYTIKQGVFLISKLVKYTLNLYEHLATPLPEILESFSQLTKTLNKETAFQKNDANSAYSHRIIAELDEFFRKTATNKIKQLLYNCYYLDALTTIIAAKQKLGMCFPTFSETTELHLRVEGMYHPALKNPVKSQVTISPEQNIFYVTGANMSGKSSYFKSIGLIIYLAHIGFPVFADKVQLSVWNGLITSINLKDNIKAGHSHFYMELIRLKLAVECCFEKRKVMVLFDELFNGTNAEDAMEASTVFLEKTSVIYDSAFFFSSHLLNLANKISIYKRVQFIHFSAEFKDLKFHADFVPRPGISYDRLGMQLFWQTGILEVLDKHINTLNKSG